ncbi:MAG TPA: hypothetical protein VIF09_10835 [Polyangiaceae bacterium]
MIDRTMVARCAGWTSALLALAIAGCASERPAPDERVALTSAAVTGVACTDAAMAPSTPSPAAPGTPVTWTATSASCTSPLYQFWVLAPGGATPWTMEQDFSSTATFAWNTSGLAGTYQLEVWVKDASSTAPYDTYASGTFTFSGSGAACDSGGLGASPSSPVVAGTPVTLTGSSATCSSPLYEFWELAPGGATGWTIVQPFGASSSYAWNTSGLAAGDYSWEVWMKDSSSSTTSYDTYAGLTYTIGSGGSVACTDATGTPSPASPQAAGTPVTITGGSSSCSNPQYEFWELAPGGQTGWTMVQGYGATSTYPWTAGPAGDYQFEVWVRDASSTGAYDSYAGFSFTTQ